MIDFIYEVSNNNRKVLSRDLELLKKVLEALTILANEEITEQDFEQNESIQDSSLNLIEILSLNLPKKKIFKLLLEIITNLITSGVNNKINTGFCILASITEGCSEQLKPILSNPIMNVFIATGLANEAPEVKGAAIKCLSFMSEHLIPEIIAFHKVIIPALIQNFSNSNTKIAEKAMIAIDIFSENMNEEIVDYLPALLPQIISVVTSNSTSNLMKTAAISAIGSCIHSSELKFKPYALDVSKMLEKIIFLKSNFILIINLSIFIIRHTRNYFNSIRSYSIFIKNLINAL